MFVYGVRCAPNDLMDLPADANADYYMDYGLLVFPQHTRPTLLQSSSLGSEFWHRVRMVVAFPHKTHRATHMEHPWLSEGEGEVVSVLQEFYPGLQPDWFYVPRTASGTTGVNVEIDDID